MGRRSQDCERLGYDVVVVGAGPAGAATAIALQKRGFSVALVERRGSSEPTKSAHGAAAASQLWPSIGESISAAAQFALRELGLWEAFQRQPFRATYLTRSVWGSDEPRERHAIEHRLGPDFHVDREHFDAWLRARAAALGADLFAEATPERALWAADRRRFLLSCSRGSLMFEAPHLIDASGRSAWLTRALGGRRHRCDDLVGIGRWYERATFEPSILVETTPTGWWYSGPSPQGRALALYMTCAKSVSEARRPDGWRQLLRQAPVTARRFAGLASVELPRICAATPTRSEWDAELPFLPVGDAAAAFDPISGSGLCFAFRSALEAASVLAEARTGRVAPFGGYQQGVRNVFSEHLRRRAELYSHEQRWPQAKFWSRLHATG